MGNSSTTAPPPLPTVKAISLSSPDPQPVANPVVDKPSSEPSPDPSSPSAKPSSQPSSTPSTHPSSMGICGSKDIIKETGGAGTSYARKTSSSSNASGASLSSRGSASERDSLFDISGDDELNTDELLAVRRIQKSVRRTKALDKAHAENQWHFFAQVDSLEEYETMRLTAFMRALVNLVPGAKELNAEHEDAAPTGTKGKSASRILLEDIILEDDNAKKQNLDKDKGGELAAHKIDKVPYVIKGSGFTASHATALIELFRPPNIGVLDSTAVQKVLRRAYKLMQKMGNTNQIDVAEGARITVVGDIHGQLEDLLLILDEAGEPSPNNILLFNGDFVDRGPHGFEVITIMFALLAAYPGCVYLNRGNHEDPFICQNYGFQQEVLTKYDDQGLTFLLFVELFKQLPLFSLINKTIFVVHGGLFHDPEVTLAELDTIDRTDYDAVPVDKYPACVRGLNPERPEDQKIIRAEKLKQFQRDALWSDPRTVNGVSANTRGAGVLFGPDVTKTFMKNNNISMIIRSHECARHGADFPFIGDDCARAVEEYYAEEEASVGRLSVAPVSQRLPIGADPLLLCTLFSASNYLEGDNEGAYMVITRRDAAIKNVASIPKHANAAGNGTGLFFTCHRYRTSAAHSHLDSKQGLKLTTKITAMDLLLRKKRPLMDAFRAMDTRNTEVVSRDQWSQIMREVTGLKILWLNIIQHVVPVHSLVDGGVLYMDFINSLRANEFRDNNRAIYKHHVPSAQSRAPASASASASAANSSSPPTSGGKVSTSTQLMDVLYGNKKRMLERIYYYFDVNSDGLISPDEFREGCKRLNEIGIENAAKLNAQQEANGTATSIPTAPHELKDVDDMLNLMDFDHSGSIDINEFFEAFRLVSLDEDGQGQGQGQAGDVVSVSVDAVKVSL